MFYGKKKYLRQADVKVNFKTNVKGDNNICIKYSVCLELNPVKTKPCVDVCLRP